jgi:hypothetical protein
MGDFHGYPISTFSSAGLELDVFQTAGPRIAALRYKGSANVLAEVPELTVATPYGDYHYQGGHRLWYAPEAMPRSYIPDDEGVSLMQDRGTVILDGKTEGATGIHKRIEIQLAPDSPRAVLTHTLSNEGMWEVELAPWAITMCRLGGVALLPLRQADVDHDGLLPDRQLAIWPYSDVQDPRLRLEDDFVAVRSQAGLPPFKIGAFSNGGWLAYWLDGILLRKTFDVVPGKAHPDLGCNSEVYCDEQMIELESLGPLVRLAPDDAVSHRETWDIFDSLDQPFLSQKMKKALEQV